MTAGGAERCVCLSVLIGTGLEYAKLGLSGYEMTSRQICHLTLSQVSDLMTASIAKENRLTVLQANAILGHRVMGLQLNLLMGLPGFMALDVMCMTIWKAASLRMMKNSGLQLLPLAADTNVHEVF